MYSWTSRLAIGSRVRLAMLMPILGMLIFAGAFLLDRYRTAEESAHLHELAQIGPQLSQLVHELQKERGRSAGFISSKGSNFADSLPTQRNDSDSKMSVAGEALSFLASGSHGDTLAGLAGDAAQRLEKLAATRQSVDQFSLTVPQMAKYYTGTITALLTIIDEFLHDSTDDVISKQIATYVDFLQGKERAGRERAMGAAGFGAGEFPPHIFQNFIRLIAMQETYFQNFRLFADPSELARFDQVLQGPVVDEVERLRQIALASPQTGTLEGVTGAEWFKAITEKINLMKEVEDFLSFRFEEVAATQAAEAWREFYLGLAFVLALLVLSAGLIIAIVRSITKPVGAMTDVMNRLAEGDKTVQVVGADRRDELGAMAKAVEIFKQNALEMERLEAEQAEVQRQAEADRKAELHGLAENFESSVLGVVQMISSSASQMQGSAKDLLTTAQETAERSALVASASQNATAGTQTVASATEELAASVTEIGRQVDESVTIAGTVVTDTNRASDQIRELSQNSQRIGEVVSLINDIAEQTNLLALNATIEAARAGEAGKGFAVVASEVKNLANQTAKATEEISGRVDSIQGATNDAVVAIEAVSGTIEKMNAIASVIASAVEQQSAATNEISASIQDAARSTQEVEDTINLVDEGAKGTDNSSRQVLQAATTLSEQSGNLQEEVNRFLAHVRAG